jgi:hypothetical protein
MRAEPRFHGVAEPVPLLVVSVGIGAIALVLFVSGHWPFGLILLGLAGLLFVAFLDLLHRRPNAPFARRSRDTRERVGSAVETWRVRAATTAEARRIQNGLAQVDSARKLAFLRLGEAVYREDAAAEAEARTQLRELDERAAALHTELDGRLEDADERIRKAQLAVQGTMMVTPNEPYPPPGEATPPEPAIVPEPYPPPDEGTPPTPAPVPEPGLPPDREE